MWYLIVVLICISLMLRDVEHFFVSVGNLYVFFGEMSSHFLIGPVLWVLSLVPSLMILDKSLFSDMSLANIFSHSVDSLLVLLTVSFAVQKPFTLIMSQ